jgi:hypothetical protein
VWTRSRGHNHSNAKPSKVSSVIFIKNIIFIFIRFVLLYYYNAFGAYVILLLFLDLSYYYFFCLYYCGAFGPFIPAFVIISLIILVKCFFFIANDARRHTIESVMVWQWSAQTSINTKDDNQYSNCSEPLTSPYMIKTANAVSLNLLPKKSKK